MKKWAVLLGFQVVLNSSAFGAYTVNIYEANGNVVAIGSGSINLAGLSKYSSAGTFNPRVDAAAGRIELGGSVSTTGTVESYQYANGPTNFGGGSNEFPAIAAGDMVGINGALKRIRVPQNYVSGADLGTSTAEWGEITLGDLGVMLQ